VIKYILISITEILQDDSDLEIQIVDSDCLRRVCKEKKTLKKTKLDLEILRKKSRKFQKLATKKKNSLLESISKFAERISMKKQKTNVMEEVSHVENTKEAEKPLISEEKKEPKVETISITLNIVEYAPKIFEKLRKIDGVGVKELTEYLI